MADQLQIRGGDTASNNSFTGAQRELTVDTSKNQLIVHDGVTPGGHPIPNSDDPTFTGDAEFSGSATFANYVDAELFNVSRTVSEGKDNYVSKLNIADTGHHFLAKNQGGNPVASINADGSSTFFGSVASDSFFKSNRTDVNETAIIGLLNGTEKVNIRAGGSASFQGDIGIGGANNPNVSLANIGLKANGSGTFTGDVVVGSDAVAVTDANGIQLANNGAVHARRFSDPTNAVFAGYSTVSGSTPTSMIASDGSVAFASKHLELESYGLLRLYRDTDTQFPVLSWGASYADRNKGELFPDGSATFSGTVTASNITAFKSRMASAVASAGDLSALKQAILDAVADL